MNDATNYQESRIATVKLFIAIASWVTIGGVFELVYRPSVIRSNSDPTRFNVSGAEEYLQRLFGDEPVRPAGSDANREVRGRLVAELKSLGFEVQLQSTTAQVQNSKWPAYNGQTVPVVNVLARKPGRDHAPRGTFGMPLRFGAGGSRDLRRRFRRRHVSANRSPSRRRPVAARLDSVVFRRRRIRLVGIDAVCGRASLGARRRLRCELGSSRDFRAGVAV